MASPPASKPRAEPKAASAVTRVLVPDDVSSEPLAAQERRNLTNLEIAAAFDGVFAPLLRSLANDDKVTPARLARMKALVLERERTRADVLQRGAAHLEAGAGASGLVNDVAAALAPFDDQIREALDEPAYSRFRSFEESIAQQNTVALVGRSLDPSAEPLTAPQTEELAAILARVPAPGEGADARLARLFWDFTAQATISDEAVQAAAGILSPQQLEGLQRAQQQQQSQRKLFAWLARLQQPAPKPPADAPP